MQCCVVQCVNDCVSGKQNACYKCRFTDIHAFIWLHSSLLQVLLRTLLSLLCSLLSDFSLKSSSSWTVASAWQWWQLTCRRRWIASHVITGGSNLQINIKWSKSCQTHPSGGFCTLERSYVTISLYNVTLSSLWINRTTGDTAPPLSSLQVIYHVILACRWEEHVAGGLYILTSRLSYWDIAHQSSWVPPPSLPSSPPISRSSPPPSLPRHRSRGEIPRRWRSISNDFVLSWAMKGTHALALPVSFQSILPPSLCKPHHPSLNASH